MQIYNDVLTSSKVGYLRATRISCASPRDQLLQTNPLSDCRNSAYHAPRYPNYGPLLHSRAMLTPSHKGEAALIIVRIMIKNNQEGQG